MSSTNPTKAMTIAGNEATGGAGFQVDIKTFHQLGVFGAGAITCVVSFDPKNAWSHRFVPMDPQLIKDQVEAATATWDLDTTKIGMLGTVPTIKAVREALATQEWKNIVLDPVLICKGQEAGDAHDTDEALKELILPLATVVTPNLFETSQLAGMEVRTEADLAEAAKRIGELGPKYVLAKGGMQLEGDEAVDLLWDGEKITRYASPKIGDERPTGAGCTLAAAITAELAKGSDIYEAVRVAKDLVTRGIEGRLDAHTPFDAVWQQA
ncbi:MAG: bifunctional hydroxymethylpyrimidine kinase/phosphomethylpyrimidine kinase [Actinomycetaceae bacterium]|nr:bifunctional hydroxymethylpyrimidine kinase/phosphomethylpyrimidine kinase [Actinomycetaceae bacterium]